MKAYALWLFLSLAGAKDTDDKCDPTRERDDAMNCSRISSPRVSCGEVTRTITASERVGSREGGARWRSLPMFIHLSFLRLSGTEKASKAEKTNTYPTRAISLKT